MKLNDELKNELRFSTLKKVDKRVFTDESNESGGGARNFDDKWIIIQKNTFTNWINETLKRDVQNSQLVNDLQSDLSNGVLLIKLLTQLQHPNPKVPKRYFKNPLNQHQSLENVSLALNAITEDGIKLVNIGKWTTNFNLFLTYFKLYFTF